MLGIHKYSLLDKYIFKFYCPIEAISDNYFLDDIINIPSFSSTIYCLILLFVSFSLSLFLRFSGYFCLQSLCLFLRLYGVSFTPSISLYLSLSLLCISIFLILCLSVSQASSVTYTTCYSCGGGNKFYKPKGVLCS